MSHIQHATTLSPADVLRLSPVQQAANGICYASSGEVNLSSDELQRMVAAVPQPIAAVLTRKAFYFVPLTVADGDQTLIADRYDVLLSDRAVCHRNLTLGDAQCVFISTRLMDDRFSVAFEFYINTAHAFADQTGFSQPFADLVWKQAEDKVKGETSLDANELRKIVTSNAPDAEKARQEYFETTFADAIAIYLLSLYLDVDYDVTVSMNTFTALPDVGTEVSLFIYTNVREDQIALFGFHRPEEKALFEKLISVSGIGPKLAVNILVGMNTSDLVATIRGGDATRLTRMPGVGKKTAERMVLELKDKLADFGVTPAAPRPKHVLEDDVLSALINLGYQSVAAERALEKLGPADGRSFEQLFRAALAQLAR